MRGAAFVMLAGALSASAWAEQPAQTPRATVAPDAPRKTSVARRAAEAPVIDGILDERAWQQAVPITDFVQAEPVEGQPASEKTEVRVLYDDEAIYIGVICYDNDPSKIITTDSRRDSPLNDMDAFEMIFDTYRDRQNGFIFGTNAAGIEYDAQVRNEGDSQSGNATHGRTQSGSGGGLNVNWDGSWDVKARVSEIGWSAEFRIPLRTLRYGPPPQVWGLNFWRNIGRKREQVYWSPVARVYTLARLSSAGELRNLDLKTPHNVKLMPYAIGSANRDFTPGSTTIGHRDWGVDAKVGVTSSMNLDLTYNTDFAQVEVDEQQINLSRFNLLFPEKRPFFLENQGLFSVGKNGKTDLFFSRRIGISDGGSLVPIRGGARLTGRTRGVNVGLIDMQTERVGETPANNFMAARVSKDLASRSSVGGIFVNRTAITSRGGPGDWNRTWGADGKVGVGESLTFNGFVARTETPGLTGHEYAYSSGVEFQNSRTRRSVEYTQVGEGFNPEVGFLERPAGFRQLRAMWIQNVRSKGLADAGIREWRPHVIYESFWGFDGFQETARLNVVQPLDWESGHRASATFNIQSEGLKTPFEVYPDVIVPPGSYRSPYLSLNSGTDRKRWVAGELSWQHGGFLSGHQNALAPTLTIRRGGRFTSSVRWARNAIDLPEGAFKTNLGSLRLGYNFTPLMNAQSLVQYNDRTKRWSTNLRFNWQQTAATGLYVVYNDTEAFDGLGPVNRAFIVKYSRLFDVLQ